MQPRKLSLPLRWPLFATGGDERGISTFGTVMLVGLIAFLSWAAGPVTTALYSFGQDVAALHDKIESPQIGECPTLTAYQRELGLECKVLTPVERAQLERELSRELAAE